MKKGSVTPPSASPTQGYILPQVTAVTAIDTTPGNRHEVVDAAMKVVTSLPTVYRRGGALVRVLRSDAMNLGDTRLQTDGERLLVATCPPEWITTELARVATFSRYDRRAKRAVRCDPPGWLSLAILADGEFASARVLNGISSSPVLRPDGSICSAAGYDPVTGVLLAVRQSVPQVPADLTHDDAVAALSELRHLLSGYLFADPYGESVALSLILSKVARHLMPTAPLHAITSPIAGTGKTHIARAASIIADGVEPSLCNWPRENDELRKTITSALIAGESFIVFDNMPNGAVLRSAALDQVLTAPVIGDRLLGRSEKVTLINGAVWVVTGNNITPSADTVRRTILARIDPRAERPWERMFTWTPAEYARKHRDLLLSAALTILSAHLRTNTEPLLTPLASFEQWSRIVRDSLLWVGMPDPVKSQDEIAHDDPDAEDRADIFNALRENFGTAPFTAEEVASAVRNALYSTDGSPRHRIADAMSPRLNGRSASARNVGYALRALRDQVSNGVALRAVGQDRTGTARWGIVPL